MSSSWRSDRATLADRCVARQFAFIGHVHQALLGTCPKHAQRAGNSQVSTLRLRTPGSFINGLPGVARVYSTA